MAILSSEETAFSSLTAFLVQHDYTFICPTPESQARVVRKRLSKPATSCSTTLEDFFGWSLPGDKYGFCRVDVDRLELIVPKEYAQQAALLRVPRPIVSSEHHHR